MNFLELAEKRYSCKQYSDRPVEADKLQAVLEAGRPRICRSSMYMCSSLTRLWKNLIS